MKLKVYWKKFQKLVNQLDLRERKLVTLTSSVAVVSIFFLIWWQPMLSDWFKLESDIVSVENNIKNTKLKIIEVKADSKIDPNKTYQQKLDKIRLSLEQQQAKIESITSALISPKNMNQVFSALLKNSELQINTIRNEPAEAINMKGDEQEINLLYKHGLSLEMMGSFNSSYKYLERVEDQYWHLYWDELIFDIKKYPHGLLTLKVHTISTNENVLGL